MIDKLIIAGRHYDSRLIVGTGKYKSFQETADCIHASGAEIVTVALRRVNITNNKEPVLMDYVDPDKYVYLPNTAGCYNAEDSIRMLNLARDCGGWNLVKLEVLGDDETLYPNMPETIIAAKQLVRDGFKVMVYCSDDIIQAKILEDIGCVAIMPLGSLIGSGMGILNSVNISIIKKNSNVPVIVDAGVGTASDAVQAMEIGCDGVLLNTAIAKANKPEVMAKAMKLAVRSGRLNFLAGRMDIKPFASPSSPQSGLFTS